MPIHSGSLVICSSNSKSFYDWIIAITPIIISLSVAYIGYKQYQINKNKFRLDLYNRRFAVYTKALEYLQAYYSANSSKERFDTLHEEFIHFYRESIFLFGDGSDVYKLLTELKDTLYLNMRIKEHNSSHPYDHETDNEFMKQKNKMREPDDILHDLEKALMPWLDFKNIEN